MKYFQVLFYAAEVILGLEHMHRRYVCYRDLKVGENVDDLKSILPIACALCERILV